jgi:t-SNARE complex subunit (syntaxin)
VVCFFKLSRSGNKSYIVRLQCVVVVIIVVVAVVVALNPLKLGDKVCENKQT